MVSATTQSPVVFSVADIGRLFPFFVLIDAEAVIVDAGESMQRLSPKVRTGRAFAEAFSPKRPEDPFQFDRLVATAGRLYTFHEQTTGTLFRGQFQPAGDHLLFVGSPWFTGALELETIGLSLNDFAPHDPTLDLLQLVQVQKVVSDDLQRLTAKLSAQTAQLEAAVKTKDAFLATMSHELRTPLTGILGLSETLLEGGAGTVNSQQTRYLQIIRSSGERLLGLVNDMLDLAKIASGREKLNAHPCPIGDICSASLEAVQSLATKRRQQLTLAEETDGLHLYVDGRRLKQAIDNLLSNAAKFTPEGGALGLRTYRLDDAVCFEVWDHGVGIAPEDVGYLFQPFFQLDTRLARRYEGVGLGLALTKLLVELHQGKISVESEPGRGSKFTISLPSSVIVAR